MNEMKKPGILIFILLIFLLCFISCTSKEEKEKIRNEAAKSSPPFTVIEIEGCEYLRFKSAQEYIIITHKGNCKNTIHCYQ